MQSLLMVIQFVVDGTKRSLMGKILPVLDEV